MYAICGKLEKAPKPINDISVRDVVSWTALISEYVEYVYVEEVQYMMNQDYMWQA